MFIKFIFFSPGRCRSSETAAEPELGDGESEGGSSLCVHQVHFPAGARRRNSVVESSSVVESYFGANRTHTASIRSRAVRRLTPLPLLLASECLRWTALTAKLPPTMSPWSSWFGQLSATCCCSGSDDVVRVASVQTKTHVNGMIHTSLPKEPLDGRHRNELSTDLELLRSLEEVDNKLDQRQNRMLLLHGSHWQEVSIHDTADSTRLSVRQS